MDKNITKEEKQYLQKLLNYIKNQGYTQREIAERVGVEDATMSRYFNGIRYPKASILLRLYKEFNIDSNIIQILKSESGYNDDIELQEVIDKLSSLNNAHIAEINKMIDIYVQLEDYEKLKTQLLQLKL